MIFDRFSRAHRSVTGAVKRGTAVKFTVTPPRSLGTVRAELELVKDGGEKTCIPMEWSGLKKDRDVYSCSVSFKTEGLFWYTFVFYCGDGILRLSENSRGEILKPADEAFFAFQQTVYKADFNTPDWIKKGVIYQIFPDRFYSSPRSKNMTKGRWLHESWSDSPDYDNDPLRITNSDFFGGDLKGIREKLPYIASLGVTVIYLNPIFEAFSNHRYDTGDYDMIDPLLGGEEDFAELCGDAKKMGIRIVLDGVFSHTGADSKYFNLKNTYPSVGASQSEKSPYYSWYDFQSYPDRYTCWWGVWSLPCVNENDPAFLEYITGENGIARKYIRLGASGWRLDVADELPDGFLDAFRRAVKEEDPQAVIIGEVWEDASNKIAYSYRRRYLLGDQLDSVMNYPFSDAILSFARYGSSRVLADTVLSITEHYPPCVTDCLMNMVSTHDTPRALTRLGGEPCDGRDRDWQHAARIPEKDMPYAKKLLRLASALQYTLPGTPSLYYGDEAGLQGYGDPFNRGTFPWGNEDAELTGWFSFLGRLRKGEWTRSPFKLMYEHNGAIAYSRGELTVIANGGEEEAEILGFTVGSKEVLIFSDGEIVYP